jgi:hypothetical protein
VTKREVQQALEDLGRKLGAVVTYDDLNFPGGHCICQGRLHIILNSRLSLEDRIRLLCLGVSELPWEAETLPVEIENLLIRKHPRSLDETPAHQPDAEQESARTDDNQPAQVPE